MLVTYLIAEHLQDRIDSLQGMPIHNYNCFNTFNKMTLSKILTIGVATLFATKS